MTADLSTVKYKREPVPAIGDSETQKTYVSDELQRIENTLNNHELITNSLSTEVDGNKSTFDQQIIVQANADSALAQSITALAVTVTNGDDASAALVSQEATARANAFSAQAIVISNLAATVENGDDANIASIQEVSDALATADAAQTRVVNAQRALYGAASADTWVLGADYLGSVDSATPANALGDDVVVGGYVYRCRQNHTSTNINKPVNSSFWDQVDTVDAKVAAGVVTASGAHASAGYAAASDLTLLTARVTDVDGDGANAGDIYTLDQSIANANSVIAVSRDNLSARFGVTVDDNYSGSKTYAVNEHTVYNGILYICVQVALGKIPPQQPLYWSLVTTVAADVSAAINTERAVRVTEEEAIAARTDVVSARIGIPPTSGTNWSSTNQYAINDEVVHASGKVFKATATPPVGTVPTNTSYWAEQSLLSATVTQQSNALVTLDGKVDARHQILLDSNGYVSGVKLSNNGATSEFRVLADRFAIQTPGTDKIPFEVDNGVVRMQNVEIGSNVLGLNSSTNVHHSVVATAYATLQNFSAYTQIGILTFTPTTTGEVLYAVNFNNAAVTSSNTLTASCRVTYGVQLRLTVGSNSTITLQGMSNLLIGGLLTGHFGNSALRTITASAVGQLHTYEVYARPTQLLNGAVKLGIYNAALSATELYR